ncbi:MAG: hypothetical protein DRI39_07270 [Chloroflexi bacterium]|nr:MAG: hypothetical protein DRI39_07270 [Chloroflexota bacterium]RLC96941.1 MAG: hypothetical protein DRI40_01680 [Chloroflexota bacterium]
MRNRILLSVTLVVALVAAVVGGAFAGFVDTEVSKGNFVQAGISDLLVNGKNDPVGAKLQFVHAAPCKSVDFWIDVYNWGECQGGDLWMHFTNVLSTEAGTKRHNQVRYVYDAVSNVGGGIPFGYRPAVGAEPQGAGVWSSEPEKIAEVGDGWVGQVYIPDDHPMLQGEDYASGIAAHLDIKVEVCDDGLDGILDDADDNHDGELTNDEYLAHDWVVIPSLTGKLAQIECEKNHLGFLPTQQYGWIHIDAHLQQIEDPEWPGDPQLRFWPTNALQGDKATWDMLFELVTDP